MIYAKARPLSAGEAVLPVPIDGGAELALPDPVRSTRDAGHGRRELLIRAFAPPAALLLAWMFVASNAGHAFVRIFATMWLHELGHAATAWLCGYGAFPGIWFTPVSTARLPGVVVTLAAALAGLAWYAWRSSRVPVASAALAAIVVQLVCTALPAQGARALVTFGGDAGAMVLGAALVMTVWSDPEGPLGRGALRWGFLGIGAASLVDALDTWLRAWRDHGQLPLGEIEGIGLSDASTLMEVHGWSAGALAGRYVTLGTVTVAVIAFGCVTAGLRLLALRDDDRTS